MARIGSSEMDGISGDIEKAATDATGVKDPPKPEVTGAGTAASEGLLRIASSSVMAAPDEPPDGGWVAWSQVIPAHIANLMTWGYGSGYAVFQLYYKQTMKLPASQVSWVGSIQLFLYFLLGLVSGRLKDAGYTRQLYLIGSSITVLGMFMTSLATEYWQILLAQGICSGIGGGLMFIPAIANVGTYFKKNRVLAMSINACGSSTGAIIFPAIVQYLTPQVGFPWAVRICGFVALFLSIVGNVLLRPRKVPRNQGPLVDWPAFKDVTFSMFSAGCFCIFFSVFTVLIYINSFAKERVGLSDIESINFVFITNATGVVARPIFGLIADKYLGAINTFGVNSMALGVMAFGWTGVHRRTDMYVYSGIMGFVNGASQGVFPGAASSLVQDVSKIGTWVGMVFALCGFATLAGPPTMGAIIDANGGDYMWAQLVFGLIIVIGAILLLVTARIVGQRQAQDNSKRRLFLKA